MGKAATVDFSGPIEVYGVKIGKCSPLNRRRKRGGGGGGAGGGGQAPQ